MTERHRRIVLAARPEGVPTSENFRLEEGSVPEAGEGEVLFRVLWLSLDPYMRGRMSAAKSYAAPVQTALGVLGMPGMTAYTGLLTIGQPKPGETVVVAAAAGPVGSAVGQIARIKGARAVGIAGGPDKCRILTEELGFDAAVDHRDPAMADALRAACPGGIDVYFENVGGPVFDAVLPLLNDFARVPVCGLVAGYNATALPEGPDRTALLMRRVLTQRLTLRGFIVSDFNDQARDFFRDMSAWVREGRVRYREDVTEGLENAPDAFVGMLKGRNVGKALVRVG